MTLQISNFGLGTSHIASLGTRISVSDAKKLISGALDHNINLIDTADTYGSGDAERLIGIATNSIRNNFFIVTKAGFPFMALPEFLSPLNQIGKKVLQKCQVQKNYSKKYLLSSLHSSLKRLNTDHVNAFMLHEPFMDELLTYDDCWEALNKIKDSGMAKYIGISTNDTKALQLATNHITVEIVQTSMPYSVNDTSNVFSRCKELDIPIIANQVLRPNKIILENIEFKNLLDSYNIRSSEIISILIAYAHFLKKSDCVLIGTRNLDHLIQNATSYKNHAHLIEIFETINKLSL